MQLPIKLKTPGSVEEDWVLIELQGDLESRTERDLAANYIGDLHFTNQDVPILIIGHHILYGKVMNLDQPFAVVNKKRILSQDEESPLTMNVDGDLVSEVPTSEEEVQTSYLVTAVIHRKILFKTRPKPIVSNVAKI